MIIGNDIICDKVDNTVQFRVSSSHSSDKNSSAGRLQNVDSEINSIKSRGDQEDQLRKEEETEKRGKEKVEEKEGVIRSVPIRLVRQPSEEGFHQVVKFTKRITRRGETELPEPKSSFTHTEFNEHGKCSSEKVVCAVSISKDLTNEELDGLSADIQSQPNCYQPTDKTPPSGCANNESIDLKLLNGESICAKSKEIHETIEVESDNLSQSIQTEKDQQKCNETEICLQMDDEAEMNDEELGYGKMNSNII
ncbi:unnamed protein product [Acanthocheilonema viteae]|uniref:Uncharacterized protein n=1 Tax=Acanthocheilonema viteae TaxID=6277 RepID=A0A498STQ7_ACAVI|nr:unnamed protein product [Acanthocheilonema viteae]